jgi:aspartate/methionine/tyrosine aminotransferase
MPRQRLCILSRRKSLYSTKRLVEAAGVGLAPGAAFGAEGEGWLR